MKQTTRIFLMIALTSVFFGCGVKKSDSGSTSQSSSSDDPTDTTPIGTIETTGLWITLKNDNFVVYEQSDDGWDTRCFIDSKETSSQEKVCTIDIMEGDMFMNSLTLQYNVPPELCRNLRVSPAWHWNESPGRGPTQVTMTVDADSNVTACTAFNSGTSTMVNCSDHPELTDTSEPAGPSCIYGDCCWGDYTLTITTLDEDGNPAGTGVSEKEWGTSVQSCIGGPGRTAWEAYSEIGYPVPLAYEVPENSLGTTVGLNGAITMPANISSSRSYFSTMANFFESDGRHNHSGYVSSNSSSKPYAIEPIDDLDGSSVPSGSEAFVFECLDDAFEVKHRITAYIREWNTAAAFLAYGSSSGTNYNPDVGGAESDCDGIGDYCNDFWDFEDILSYNGNTYNTTTPDADAREDFFPNVEY